MAISWDGAALVPATAYIAGQRYVGADGNVYQVTTAGTSLPASVAAWAPSHAYVAGAYVANAGGYYVCVGSGTSAASGGPSGNSRNIADNSATWNYAGTGPGDWTGTALVNGTLVATSLGAFTGAVISVAPELATGVTVPSQVIYMNLADQMIASVEIWTVYLDDARRYMAAHLGQLAKLRGHGPLTAEHVGPLSRGYAALMGPKALQLTTAGREYLELLNLTPAIFGFVG